MGKELRKKWIISKFRVKIKNIGKLKIRKIKKGEIKRRKLGLDIECIRLRCVNENGRLLKAIRRDSIETVAIRVDEIEKWEAACCEKSIRRRKEIIFNYWWFSLSHSSCR